MNVKVREHRIAVTIVLQPADDVQLRIRRVADVAQGIPSVGNGALQAHHVGSYSVTAVVIIRIEELVSTFCKNLVLTCLEKR